MVLNATKTSTNHDIFTKTEGKEEEIVKQGVKIINESEFRWQRELVKQAIVFLEIRVLQLFSALRRTLIESHLFNKPDHRISNRPRGGVLPAKKKTIHLYPKSS